MKRLNYGLTLIVAVTTLYVNGTELDSALQVQQKTNAGSTASQQRINSSAENTLQLKAEIAQLQQKVENLELYGNHLSSLTVSQQQEISSLNKQIEEINLTRQGVIPLMYRMIAALHTQIAGDMPIKPEQRLQRVEKLQRMMKRADVSDAEKYRRILEAYQIELDYGTKFGLFRSTIKADNQERQVEVLHLGRLSLVARSLNAANFWAWYQNSKSWQPLPDDLKPELDKAFSIAAQRSAPELLTLPLSLAASKDK